MSKKEISDERNWEAHFQEFVEYKRVHGDYNVPRGGKLGNWVHHQRRTKGKMSEERRKRLDSIGFVWKDIRDAHNSDLWEARFQELVEYKRVHRDCYVPRHYTANKQLGGWVSKQRTKEETMSEERRKRLNSIETPIFGPWEVRFQQLLDYERVHGNCNVPYNYKANLKLGTWVSTQRSTKETMRENRRNQLNSIGFVWSLKHEPTRSDLWEVRFQELVEYKRVHRDCNVPRHYKANKQLGTWVNTQRENKEKMREERRKRLDSIGFVWKLRATPISVPWEVRFQQLLDYKRVHGNCNVPYNYKANLKLRTWVNTQRTKEETMRDERRKRLNSIGFTWKILEARIAVDWEIRFKQLVE